MPHQTGYTKTTQKSRIVRFGDKFFWPFVEQNWDIVHANIMTKCGKNLTNIIHVKE